MTRLLEARRALITGGSSGIGAGIVARFAAEGAGGVVLDLPDALDAATLPPGFAAVPLDLRDDGSIEDAFARAAELEPRLDLVVAAAGIVPGWASIADLDLGEWDAVMAVNARGVAATVSRAAPSMGDGGAIVVVASLNSWRADPNLTPYVASKHAALGIVRAAAVDLGRRGIRVNAVAPGPVATEALLERVRQRERERGIAVDDWLAAADRATALGRIATVDDVAAAVLFLASDLAGGVTGHLLPVDGGIA
jgi:NAD(P)-dependent dehydrogenase (short-subunit alcohol dehydrogenase family)